MQNSGVLPRIRSERVSERENYRVCVQQLDKFNVTGARCVMGLQNRKFQLENHQLNYWLQSSEVCPLQIESDYLRMIYEGAFPKLFNTQ